MLSNHCHLLGPMVFGRAIMSLSEPPNPWWGPPVTSVWMRNHPVVKLWYPWERVPYLSALEVWSRQRTIQITFTFTSSILSPLPRFPSLFNLSSIELLTRSEESLVHYYIEWWHHPFESGKLLSVCKREIFDSHHWPFRFAVALL